MPKVSINILTKDRPELFNRAWNSIQRQSFKDFELVIIDDHSTDENRDKLISWLTGDKIIWQPESKGITFNRQLALQKSVGEYIAILDDDDEWTDIDKLDKQVKYLDKNKDVVLVGGGIKIGKELRLRSESDEEIRRFMLVKNNFFTSTVMFRREDAIKAGGFISSGGDVAEDYDLWLRLGLCGKMYNFQEAFTSYTQNSYNKAKFKQFLNKQLSLIKRHKTDYPGYWLSFLILKLRIFFGI